MKSVIYKLFSISLISSMYIACGDSGNSTSSEDPSGNSSGDPSLESSASTENSNSSNNDDPSVLRDPRDGQTYKIVTIGEQTWMAENLNYATDSSFCMNDDPENCKIFGRLYTWEDAQKVCPAGWLLPSNVDYEILFASVGGMGYAAKKLKAKDGWEWNESKNVTGNGDDSFGFAVLPAGSRNPDGSYSGKNSAFLWAYSEFTQNYRNYEFSSSEDYVDDQALGNSPKSIRCIKETNSIAKPIPNPAYTTPCPSGVTCTYAPTEQLNPSISYGEFLDTRDNTMYKTVTIGSQTWMAQHLNFEPTFHFCFNCAKYGTLYTWIEATTICPSGWHLPSDAEFSVLMDAVGGTSVAGTKLKSQTGWDAEGNGLDEFGFAILPAGEAEITGDIDQPTRRCGLWSSDGSLDENGYGSGHYWKFTFDSSSTTRDSNYNDYHYSVRCLKD